MATPSGDHEGEWKRRLGYMREALEMVRSTNGAAMNDD